MAAVELPGLYADNVAAIVAVARPLLVNRDPGPGETGVPLEWFVALEVLDPGPDGVDRAATRVWLDGVLAFDGAAVPEIVRGLHRAIAERTRALVKRVAPSLDGLQVAMTGGVARNKGVVRALSEALGTPIRVPGEPDTIGALGAALIARDRAEP